MINLANRQVWMFREPRSGSTGLTQALADKLNKTFLFIENKNQIVYDSSVLLNTHNFNLLDQIKEEHNPILLRCTRKDKFEQFLSLNMLHLTRFTNIYTHQDGETERINKFNKFVKENNKEITKTEMLKFLVLKKNENLLWNQIASKFENHVFYYEDSAFPVDIPVLGMYNINIELEKYTEKIPEYKKDFYTNYDMVKQWMNIYSNDNS